jgi:hypothetical protein
MIVVSCVLNPANMKEPGSPDLLAITYELHGIITAQKTSNLKNLI